jgi:hypothetical protein
MPQGVASPVATVSTIRGGPSGRSEPVAVGSADGSDSAGGEGPGLFAPGEAVRVSGWVEEPDPSPAGSPSGAHAAMASSVRALAAETTTARGFT